MTAFGISRIVSSVSADACAPLDDDIVASADPIVQENIAVVAFQVLEMRAQGDDLPEDRLPELAAREEDLIALNRMYDDIHGNDGEAGVSMGTLVGLRALVQDEARNEDPREFRRTCNSDPLSTDCRSKFPAHALLEEVDQLVTACTPKQPSNATQSIQPAEEPVNNV